MIRLDNNYFIETDANNFTLRFERTLWDEAKKKDVKSTNEWYCRDLSRVLNIYMNECLKPSEDVVSLRAELNRIEELINNIK